MPTRHERSTTGSSANGTSLLPIQMLWYGRPVGPIERLSMASFLAHGHPVHLYVYGDVPGVPDGVTVLDAGQVVAAGQLAWLRERGVKPGIFSDYFRASLLRQRGGWWVDTDVVCLKPFDFRSDIVFAWEDSRYINGAVMKLPRGHEATRQLTALCHRPNRWMRRDPARQVARKVRNAVLGRNRLYSAAWGATGPAAVTSVARSLGISHCAFNPETFYPVHYRDCARLYEAPALDLGSATFAVHLWNEVRPDRSPAPGSPIAKWMESYGLA